MANNKLISCKHCGAQIAKAAKICPMCGGKNKKPIFLRPWFFVLLILVIIIAVGAGGKTKEGTQKVGTVNQASSQIATEKTSNQEKDPEERTEVKEAEKEPESEIKSIYEVGDILQDGNLRIVYTASGEYQSDNQFLQPKEGHRYIFLEFAFINEGKSNESISAFSFEAYADGYNIDMFYGQDDTLSATLSPGRATTGRIYFEVPVDATEIEIEDSPNVFLDKKIKFIYEGEKDSGYSLEVNQTRTDGALAAGEAFENKNLRITYLSCEDYESDNMFVKPKEGYHFVSLILEFENLGSSDRTISSFSFNCYADGAACDSTYIRDDDLSATISAGRKAKGSVTFEVPDAAEVIEVEFNNNVWTSDRIVFTIK